jgi:hypothetical protein
MKTHADHEITWFIGNWAWLCGACFLALYYWRKWGSCSFSSKQLFCSMRYWATVQRPSAPADGAAPFFFLPDVLPKIHWGKPTTRRLTWLSILFFITLEMPFALACFHKPLHLGSKLHARNQYRRHDHRRSTEKPTTAMEEDTIPDSHGHSMRQGLQL